MRALLTKVFPVMGEMQFGGFYGGRILRGTSRGLMTHITALLTGAAHRGTRLHAHIEVTFRGE
jgi:hypothetical protein